MAIFKPYRKQPIHRPAVQRALVVQTIIALALAMLLMFINRPAGFGAIWGIISFSIAQAYFAFKVFAYMGGDKIDRLINSVYKGEFAKVILVGSMFVIAFVQFPDMNFLMMFVCYLLMTFVNAFLNQILINNPR